jgi:hypothetical protein
MNYEIFYTGITTKDRPFRARLIRTAKEFPVGNQVPVLIRTAQLGASTIAVHVKVLVSRIPISDAKSTVIQTMKMIHQLHHRHQVPTPLARKPFIEQTFL